MHRVMKFVISTKVLLGSVLSYQREGSLRLDFGRGGAVNYSTKRGKCGDGFGVPPPDDIVTK